MKKVNEIVTVKCVDFTFDGQGLCKDENSRTYFVPSLLIGETAEIEVLYRKKDYDIGKIKKIIEFSKDRIKPRCPCATTCGGCSFQNLDYQKELEYKRKVAIQTLSRIAKINASEAKIFGMEDPYYYRNKIQVPFGYDKQNRLIYGFYKIKSHDIVNNESCVIESKEHVNILRSIKKLMLSMKMTAYKEDEEEGLLRHVLIRVGKVTKEVMVVLVTTKRNFPSKNNFVKALVKENPEITTVLLNENPRRTNVILGNYEEILYGPGFIYDYLLGVKFKISSRSFYQINHDQCERLYSLAIEKAELKDTDVILDAYCGIGTIGLIASKHCKEVYGVEIVEEAIKDAKRNASINRIQNTHFLCKDASEYALEKQFDVVFVDPPRKGLDSNFLNSLLNSKPQKIVYVSCDVGTLARDIALLKKDYDVKSIDFVDMFPRTYHVESIVLFQLKDRTKN